MLSGPAAEFFLSFFNTFWMRVGEILMSEILGVAEFNLRKEEVCHHR